MSLLSMTFNGIRKEWLILERGRQKPMFAPFSRQTLNVPNKPGVYLTGTEISMLTITQPIAFLSDGGAADVAYANQLAEWLYTDDPVALEFDDEPGITYFAMLETSPDDLEKMARMRKGTLTFVCPDPYKYGPEKEETFTDSYLVHNAGTAETPPVFRAVAQEPVTFIDIVKDSGEYMRVGDPGRLDQTPYSRTTTVMTDDGTSTVGWTDATSVDNGYVGGQMVGTTDGFHPQSYGVAQEPHGWQGPAKKRSLPEPVGGIFFEANVDLKNLGNSNETGMIEVYFLDANNNTVAKVGIEDVWRGMNKVQGKMQLGPDDSERYADYHEFDRAWNNFQGKLGFYRYMTDSGHYQMLPYFAYLDDNGEFRFVSDRRRHLDTGDDYAADITQVQIAMRAWPGVGASEMYMRDIKVKEYNEQPGGIPYIAETGDIIEVDHDKAVIRINGEERKDLKYDFGSAYFDLDPGHTTLHTFPEGAFETTVTWRDAYK